MSRSASSDLGMSVGTFKGDRQTFMYFGGQVDKSNVGRFRKCLFQAIGQGCHEIVVDLAHVEFITSAGLAALIEAARLQRATAGSLLLRSLRPQPQHLLDLTGLANLFEPFPATSTA
jgi:anti-sigma B factor antagonist